MKLTPEILQQIEKLKLPQGHVHEWAWSHCGYIFIDETKESIPVGLANGKDEKQFKAGTWYQHDGAYGLLDAYGEDCSNVITQQIFNALEKGIFEGKAKFRFMGRRLKLSRPKEIHWKLIPADELGYYETGKTEIEAITKLRCSKKG